MIEKPKLEFEVDFETQMPRMYPLGRIAVGLSDGLIRVFLKPDGLHYFVPQSAMGKFIHTYEDSEGVIYAGLG